MKSVICNLLRLWSCVKAPSVKLYVIAVTVGPNFVGEHELSYEGRSINKLRNSVILLVFQI